VSGKVLSLNLGRPAPSRAGDGHVTGIGKAPVDSARLRPPGPKLSGRGSGIEGDFIGSRRHHGGDQQAVYAYAREELDRWEERLGRQLPNGMFGENLTTVGVDVDGALIGERWAIGDEVVLEVCAPRIPCATFQARMGEKGWVKRFIWQWWRRASSTGETASNRPLARPMASKSVWFFERSQMISTPRSGLSLRIVFPRRISNFWSTV
jgi:MOSC domain-containing protein YiiM